MTVRLAAAGLLVAIFTAACGSSQMSPEAADIYDKLRSIMRDRYAYLESLPPTVERSTIISEMVCPHVVVEELEALFNAKAQDFERRSLSLDNYIVPGADTLWLLWGDRKPGGRELLEVYTGPQFCAAHYTITI